MEHQPRHELKYIISTADAPALQERLERTLKRDIHEMCIRDSLQPGG